MSKLKANHMRLHHILFILDLQDTITIIMNLDDFGEADKAIAENLSIHIKYLFLLNTEVEQEINFIRAWAEFIHKIMLAMLSQHMSKEMHDMIKNIIKSIPDYPIKAEELCDVYQKESE